MMSKPHEGPESDGGQQPSDGRRSDSTSVTDDDKWLVIKGRRWRRTDPELPPDVVEELKSHLGKARSAVRTLKKSGSDEELKAARHRVNTAKHGLGERGDYWWEMDIEQRRRRAEAALEELR